MNLRQARLEDHWRHVFRRTYPSRFTNITFTNLGCLADSTLNFAGGITAIVGSNGVGKSTLIGAIADLLFGESETVPYGTRLKGSSTGGIAFVDGTELQLGRNDSQDGVRVSGGSLFTGSSRWLDPSDLAARCVHQIKVDQHFSDLLEPVSPQVLARDELDVACYLVGKHYSEIEMYEIADYGGFDRFPYVRATFAGTTYGSEAMGRGELSLLLSYWTLRDLPKNSILILEEPETHVSPRSQDCLMNIVAKFSDEMGVWVIVTTHSPTVIQHIPNDRVLLLARGNGPSTFVAETNKIRIAETLGGGVALKGVLLVEDAGAKNFLLSILEEIAPDMSRQFEVLVAGSESKITDALKAMPVTRSWLTLIGVYDGDMRPNVDQPDLEWPFLFFPGDVAPEGLLLTRALSDQDFAAQLAEALNRPPAQIILAMDQTAGIDPHDYMREFSNAIAIEASVVLRAFVRIWLSDAGNRNLAQQLIADIQLAANRRQR